MGQMEDYAWTIELSDFPGGTSTAMICKHPTAPDGGYDIALPAQCDVHGRTIWWCLNAGDLWCDGGIVVRGAHTWPDMVPIDGEPE